MVKSKKESEIVSKAHDFAKLRGWWTIKVDTPTCNGVPDRLYLRDGRYVWIEWKRPDGGELSAIQIRRIKEMREHGAEVHVLDNLTHARAILI